MTGRRQLVGRGFFLLRSVGFSVFSCCNHHPRRFSIREGQQLRSQAKQQPKKTAGFHSKHCLSFLRHQDDHHSVCRYSLVYTTVDGENTAPPTWHVTIPQLPRTPFLTLFPVWMGRCKIAVVGSGPKDGVFMTTLQRGAGRDGIVCILSGARFPPST